VEADSIREFLFASPPLLAVDFPGHEAVSFRILTVKDLGSLIARLDLSPVELVIETLAYQIENLPDAGAVIRQLPRPTLLRLARSWAAHPATFGVAPSQIRKFSDFKKIAREKVHEWDRAIREPMERLANSFSELISENQKSLAKLFEVDRQITDALAKQMKELAASFDSAGSKIEGDARELGKRGWTMPMWGPIDLVPYLAQFTARELDVGLKRQYSRRGNELEKELLARLVDKPALLRWRSLLSECIDVYRRRKYRVVVPSLLTILEGAVVSAIDLYSRKPPMKVAAQRVYTHDPGVIRAAWASVQTFLEEVFCTHDFNSPRRPLINRHWICHGRDIPEWDKVDCLRLFQALDTIAALIGSGVQSATGKRRPDREGS
jgi:hypothetical protein